MDFVIHRISLDINTTSSQVILRVKKGETSRKVQITLREGGQPYHIADGCEAIFSTIKPDGISIYNHCEIKDNTIIYTFTEQTTPAVGMMDCEIILKKGDQTLFSPRFTIVVEEGLFNGDAVISTSEATALEDLISRATTATANAENLVGDIKDGFANALNGTAEGEFVQVDDISPIEHSIGCRVRSKNLWNTLDDYNGYDYSYANGAVTITGRYVHKFITLEEGKSYTFSCTSIRTGEDGGGVYVAAYTEDRKNNAVISAASNISKLSPTVTITVPKGYPVIRFTLYGYYESTGNGTATYTDIMLEEGTEATGYVPYVDPATVKVTRCGKNLFTTAGRTVTDFGAYDKETVRTIKENCIYKGLAVNNFYDDAFIISSNTTDPRNITFKTTNNGGYGLGFSYKVNPGDVYTLSVSERPTTSSRLALSFYSADGVAISFAITAVGSTDKSISATVPEGAAWMIVLLVSTDASIDVTFKNVQLELSSVATEYEPFNASQTYPVNADGTVEGMISLYPTMVLLTDTANTVISCEYTRDSNKVIKELYDYINYLTSALPKTTSIKLDKTKWVGSTSPYSQVVSIPGTTPHSQVDLTPSVEQLAIFHEKDLAFVTENEDGTITVFAIGQKPTNDYTIQATITEVNI